MQTSSASKTAKIPGPDHPISITPSTDHIEVTLGGIVVADTHAALKLQESSYPAVLYVPLSDVDMRLLALSSHVSYCPYKGDCSYYTIVAGASTAQNAVWRYAKPYAAVEEIENYVAFYPDRVDQIKITPAA